MKKLVVFSVLLMITATVQAEWFQVQRVTSYNQISAIRPDAPANAITIRIRNLQNIRDIQVNPTKVLLSGKSALELARDCLEGQLVWIEEEELDEESGIYVGSIYLSYEQVIRAFAEQRMVGGQTITPELKNKINQIATKMLRQLDTNQPFESTQAYIEGNKRAKDPNTIFSFDLCYQEEYLKGVFVYEALTWFKDTGQFLPDAIQSTYIGWLQEYQSAPDQRAGAIEMKIRGMTVRYQLFEDFIFDD